MQHPRQQIRTVLLIKNRGARSDSNFDFLALVQAPTPTDLWVQAMLCISTASVEPASCLQFLVSFSPYFSLQLLFSSSPFFTID